jgi:GT2 family glycosyltransferase
MSEHQAQVGVDPVFTFIIVTFNSANLIPACVQSIRSASSKSSHEIIIADNASSDATLEVVSNFANVTLIKNASNLGFAKAVNHAAALAKGKYIFLLNPDAVLEPACLDHLAKFLRDHPDAAIAGCRLKNEGDGTEQRSVWKPPTLGGLIAEMFLPYGLSLPMVTESSAPSRQVPSVTGAAMIIRKDVFESCGGFDDEFFLYYEDVDLCLRARVQGLKIYIVADAVVSHRLGGSSKDNPANFFRMFYTARLKYYQKHHPVSSGVVSTIVRSGILVRYAAYSLLGIFSKQFSALASAHRNPLP